MVTVEQGGGLEQAGSSTTQAQDTQGIQQTNGGLQPNANQTGNFQNVLSTSDLLNTAGASAVITIPGSADTSAGALLASEKSTDTPTARTGINPAIFWGGVGLAVLLFVAVLVIQMRKSPFKQ